VVCSTILRLCANSRGPSLRMSALERVPSAVQLQQGTCTAPDRPEIKICVAANISRWLAALYNSIRTVYLAQVDNESTLLLHQKSLRIKSLLFCCDSAEEQQIGDVQRQELLAAAFREDNMPMAAISIHTNKNVDSRPENLHCQALQSLEGAAGSSARGYTCLLLPLPAYSLCVN